MSRTTIIPSAATLVLGVAAAQAHPRLQASNPTANAVLKDPPREIRMNFSEGLVPAFSGVELKTAAGKAVPTGKAMMAPGGNKAIIVPIGARLAAGSYTVAWHAVSVDTHRITGSYSFKVMR